MSVTNQAIVIRVRNAADLVRRSGAIASFAQQLLPTTLESEVYSRMAKELDQGLRAKGVDAEVAVVEPAGWRPVPNISLKSAAIGAGAAGLFATLLWLWWRR
jgi:hypothetical protein